MKRNKEIRNPKRGIETLFRILSASHIRLSEMADQKSHMMITVNSIILSLIITVLLRQIQEYSHLTIPTILLLSVNVVALIFAVLTTRPSLPKDNIQPDEFEKGKINLMFFGHFRKLSSYEYESLMIELLNDSDSVYKNLIRDVYSQGVVLTKKYRFLRWSYNVFMYGIIGSVLLFIVASFDLW